MLYVHVIEIFGLKVIVTLRIFWKYFNNFGHSIGQLKNLNLKQIKRLTIYMCVCLSVCQSLLFNFSHVATQRFNLRLLHGILSLE